MEIAKTLQDTYGAGVVFNEICVLCGYESEELYSSGVHESESGSLRIYDEDDVFKCPNCEEKINKEGISLS